MMKVLFLGDIFGKPGRYICIEYLPELLKETQADFCIANGENVAQGRGITEKTSRKLFTAGVDAFTSGNHLWDQKESVDFIKTEQRIIRPLNYPQKAVGATSIILRKEDLELAVLSLTGQAFMGSVNSPFEAADTFLKNTTLPKAILADVHAEATAEKRALGYYLDGRVSALVGTHTHIQTADEEILPKGTAYITDVGMTGPHDSIIGVKKEIILEKMLSGMPVRHEISTEGLQINGVLIEIDIKTGKAQKIERIRRKIDG